MKRTIALGAMLVFAAPVIATELVHEFKSPAFSGVGYSSHVLTIEQLESNRKKAIKDEKQAELDKADREYKSTNAYKFKNNLESRIYAQLSKQIADSMFGDIPVWAESTTYSKGAIVVYNGVQYKSKDANNLSTPSQNSDKWEVYNPEWITSQTPFGDTVSWKREDNKIYVNVKNSNGDTVAEFDVPVGEFAF
jgi:hypothetical protein